MQNNTIFNRCNITKSVDEDGFVGIRSKNGKIQVSFPLGYHIDENCDDTVIRKDIFQLLTSLKKYDKKSSSEELSIDKTDDSSDFPILSYQYIINDFLSNGYYVEKETIYKNGTRGKINWKRTIQQKTPQISGDNVVYLDFIVKQNRVKSNSLITKIHEYCVYDSFMKIGWLYTPFLPKKPEIPFNKSMFIDILKSELSQTFNERKRSLFSAMISIVESLDNSSVTDHKTFVYGTSNYQYVWEKMIDALFGEIDKEKYFPTSKWHLASVEKESSKLYPDTIIKLDNRIYILDAKYYKYCVYGTVESLPRTDSIQKQITYAEYLENDKSIKPTGRKKPYDSIKNAFIMPFDELKNANYKDKDGHYAYIGYATAEWKNDNKEYEYVLGILVDTKYLISCVTKHSMQEINTLTKYIDKNLNNEILPKTDLKK